MSIQERIDARAEELRESTKGMEASELWQQARMEHIWAMGSRKNEDCTEHEINADAYRKLAREKEDENTH